MWMTERERMWMKFNRCFTEDAPGSREWARVNPGSPRALLFSLSLALSLFFSHGYVHTRARRVRVTRVSAAVLTRRHAPLRACPPYSPLRCARRRATCHPRVGLRKTHNCHNIREHVAASRRPWKDHPPIPGIEIASALRLVNRSAARFR